MTKRFLALLLVIALFQNSFLRAEGDDEGMWLPFLVQKLNISKMQEMGLKLSAEDIYSINKGSLKDAVIALDHGSCSGELVSPEGLFLTNHHCGYGEIQAHSTVDHDYLTDGFWAMSRKEELANPDKTVSFLIRIEDVTDKINAALTATMSEDERNKTIEKLGNDIAEKAKDGTHYEASVESFFKGNNYYLFVYETFMDVRLVGAPPSSIGKYGADTDNWMWPRHTGDFSMFRIYCAPDGTPAEYSEDNVPYKPKHYFPISLKGYEKGDYAMVMGYPGSTTRYLNSWGVQQTMDNENTIRIKLRGIKQDIMSKSMDTSDKIRIQYASKYSRSSNYYKYSQGQNLGLKNLDVVAKKGTLEKELTKWIKQDPKRKVEYGEALKLVKNSVKKGNELNIANNYWLESFWLGPEVIRFSWTSFRQLSEYASSKSQDLKKELEAKKEEFFKDYYLPIDKDVFIAMMKTYQADVPAEYHPSFFTIVKNEYNNSFEKYADDLYTKSIFANEELFDNFLKKPSSDVLRNDPAFEVANAVISLYGDLQDKSDKFNSDLAKGERLFVKALLEKESNKAHYPDANSTMRVTYGSVGDYVTNGKQMPFKTNMDEYISKGKPTAPKNDEFYVHQRLIDLYNAKDYGDYAEKDGSMTVCFTTNNDITGGNSGSPVINGNGELIGIAFDGNWEAMSGDIAYEPNLQKCINVDIRFVLFVIDKYAGASHLIKEMSIVK